MSEKVIVELKLTDLQHDPRCQVRAVLPEQVAQRYAEVLREGGLLPPVVVFRDAKRRRWLAAGQIRLRAHELAERKTITVEMREGELREAILFAIADNALNSAQMLDGDLDRAVDILLADPEWGQWSDSEISRRTCASRRRIRNRRTAREAEKVAKPSRDSSCPRGQDESLDGRSSSAANSPRVVKVERGGVVYTARVEPVGFNTPAIQPEARVYTYTPPPPVAAEDPVAVALEDWASALMLAEEAAREAGNPPSLTKALWHTQQARALVDAHNAAQVA